MLEEEGILPLPSLMEAWRPPTGGKRILRGAYVRVGRGGSGRGGQARAAPLNQAARVVDALRAKVEAEGPAQSAEAPVEEAPAEAAAEATADVAEGGDTE